MPKTNREKLAAMIPEILAIGDDDAISPTPFEHLHRAVIELRAAMQFVLDIDEQDGVTKPNLLNTP